MLNQKFNGHSFVLSVTNAWNGPGDAVHPSTPLVFGGGWPGGTLKLNFCRSEDVNRKIFDFAKVWPIHLCFPKKKRKNQAKRNYF